jgi:2-polyprenyl-3-methyl-5-hydroxy-6-metoxy-1,4-benzoquinol methylase
MVHFIVSRCFSSFERALSLRAKRGPDAHEGVAIPPAHLITAVSGTPHVDRFLDGGHKAASGIRDILRKNGYDVERLPSILDFGCGCGRVLRWWKGLSKGGIELHGTDYNRKLATWADINLPFAKVAVNRLKPPTQYPNSRFDFIYAISVFTHLPEQHQIAWMTEFRRLLRPDGLLFLSLHGASYRYRFSNSEWRRFSSGELVVRRRVGAGSNLCNTFHPELYVRNVLSKGFRVIDFIPEGAMGSPHQDAWLMRRLETL